MGIQWLIKHHSELSLQQLYGILKLRNAVFIVELNGVFNDTDGEDLVEDTYHMMGVLGDEIIAYLRLKWVRTEDQMLIQRVVVAKQHRGQGLAAQLMDAAIQWCKRMPVKQIRLCARIHLKKFYESLGFDTVTDLYFIETVQVWHVDMIKSLQD